MKKIFAVALATVTTLAMSVSAFAMDAPNYYYDFEGNLNNAGLAGETDTALTIVGSGAIADDARGKVIDNVTGSASAQRTDYLKLPEKFLEDLAAAEEFSLSMWVKSPASNNDVTNWTEIGDGWAPIFTAQNPDADWQWTVFGVRGTMHVNNGGFFDNNAYNTNNYDGYLDDNEWHHLVYTVTATKSVVYLDGEVLNSLDRTDTGDAFSDLYTIATIGGYHNHCWTDRDSHLLFDDVAIWFDELDAAGVASAAAGEFIQETETEEATETGDMTAVLPVVILAVAAMAVVVAMRKRTVAE